jgi:hypothetical protein
MWDVKFSHMCWWRFSIFWEVMLNGSYGHLIQCLMLKMETLCSFTSSASVYQSTWHNTSKDWNLHVNKYFSYSFYWHYHNFCRTISFHVMLAHSQHDKKRLQNVDEKDRLQLWRETLHSEQAVMNDHHGVILHTGSWICHWQLPSVEGQHITKVIHGWSLWQIR